MNNSSLIINGEEISFDTVAREAERMRPHYDRMVRERNRAANDDELYQWARDNVIESTLLKQEAEKRLQKAEEPEDQQKKISRLVDNICAKVDEPAEKEMKVIYQQYKHMFVAPEQVHASHIVRHARNPAEMAKAFLSISEAKQALDNGEPFESVAARMSDCAGNGGDLGVFPRGQMVQEFEDIVFSMKPGECSNIFLTDFGYHIAKLHKKIPPQNLPFEKVKSSIKQQMIQERKQLKLNAFVDELKKNAEIKDA